MPVERTEVERIVKHMLTDRFGVVHYDRIAGTPASGGGGAPEPHASTHEPGGSDPLTVNAAAGTGSLRTLGTGATQAAAGDHTHALLPTAGEKAAAAGTSGSPSDTNRFVTNADPRNTNARTPTAHAATHQPGGSDAMVVDAAASTGSLRTLGTGATQAAAGNAAPNAHAASHQPGGSDAMAVNAAAGTGSLRTLGTTSTSAAAGNHSHTNLPTAGEKAALAGTSGTPANGNRYVTDSDPRLSGTAVTLTRGTGSINVAGVNNATTTISHGLGTTPASVAVTPGEPQAATAQCDPANHTSTQFTVRISHRDGGTNFPGGTTVAFNWIAVA